MQGRRTAKKAAESHHLIHLLSLRGSWKDKENGNRMSMNHIQKRHSIVETQDMVLQKSTVVYRYS